MHRFRSGIVGIVIAGWLAGCGGGSVDEGPKGFTPTDTKPYEPMLKEMQEKQKDNSYTKKAVPTEGKKDQEKKK